MSAALLKLRALFSQQNLLYLDTILGILVDGDNPKFKDAYMRFWSVFRGRLGSDQENHANQAWSALRQLRSIVREQLDKS